MKKYNLLIIAMLFVLQPCFSQSFQWVTAIGSAAGDDVPVEISSDASGNVITVGYFTGTVDFDPGSGVTNMIAKGDNDIYIQKLDAAGNLLWVRTIGGNYNDKGGSVTTDASGNVYIAGLFSDTVDFDPGAGVSKLYTQSPAYESVFVMKLNSAGIFTWAKTEPSANLFEYKMNGKACVRLDNTGNVFLTYNYEYRVMFYLSKYSNSGTYLWSEQYINNTGKIHDISLAIDKKGAPILSGTFSQNMDFDIGTPITNTLGGAMSTFILKLDPVGYGFKWVKVFYSIDTANNMVLDAYDNIYITGAFAGTIDFDPGAGTYNLTAVNTGFTTSYLVKLDSTGIFKWAKSYPYAIISGIEADASLNIYTTGSFGGSFTLNQGSTPVKTFTGTGTSDAFLQKMTAAGDHIWARQIAGTFDESGTDIAINPVTNDVYMAGNFSDTAAVFNYPYGTKLASNGYYLDAFVAKFSNCLAMDTTMSTSPDTTFTIAATGVSYQWINCATKAAIPGATSKSYKPTTSGSYAAAINSGGCYDTSSCYSFTVVIPPGNVGGLTPGSVSIYPNPAKDDITIDMGRQYAHITVTIKSVIGNTVHRYDYTNKQQLQASLGDASGIYFIQLKTEDGNSTVLKVVKTD